MLSANTSDWATVDTAGNGIAPPAGTTPFIDFHLGGLAQDYNVRLINDANGDLTMLGTWMRAPAFVTTSDARLKQNIQPLTGVLPVLSQLSAHTYDWTPEAQQQLGISQNLPQIGFLAQELQQAFPAAVHSFDDGSLGVNYDAMVPVLLQAIRELENKVDLLERRLGDK